MMNHQVKSSRYYLFWGIMAVAVVGGQLYVGLGYRMMARNVGHLTQVILNAMEPQPQYNSIVCQELTCVPVRKPSTDSL